MYSIITYSGLRWFQVEFEYIATFPDSVLIGVVSIFFGILFGWGLPRMARDEDGLDIAMVLSNNAPFIVFPIFLVYQPAASWIFAGAHLISSGINIFAD